MMTIQSLLENRQNHLLGTDRVEIGTKNGAKAEIKNLEMLNEIPSLRKRLRVKMETRVHRPVVEESAEINPVEIRVQVSIDRGD